MTHHRNSETRDLLHGLFSAAVNASRGDRVIPAVSRLEDNHWIYSGPGEALSIDLPTGEGRVIVVGAGKAAASMASGLEAVLRDRIDTGVVIDQSTEMQAHLADNDVYPLLEAMGDLYKSGPTGTNVMDLVAAVVGGS